MTIDVYEQYFEAYCVANGVERHAAKVMLISDSEAGNIRYEVAVTFFPHTSEEDFAISYDAFYSTVVYEARGRRSKKREEKLLNEFQKTADELAAKADARVFWDRPLREARRG